MGKGLVNDSYKYIQELLLRLDNLEIDVKNLKKDNRRLKIISDKYEKLIEENRQLKAKNKLLEKENLSLKKEILLLRNEIDRLKKQINNDSNNSSKPPSTDIKKNIPNNRDKSKKNIGGQKGHKANFLSKEYIEDKIKDKTFEHKIVNIGEISDNFISKYILDVVVSVEATEYRFHIIKLICLMELL